MRRLLQFFRMYGRLCEMESAKVRAEGEADRYAGEVLALTAKLAVERERNNQLTLDLIGMRLETIKLQQIVTAPPPAADEEKQKAWAEIEEALDQIGLQGAPRRQQVAWAERLMRQGVKPAEVVQMIRQGADDDGA